jgi:hypothetical protein
MCTVALLGWKPGFIVNRLVEMLRGHGYSLADAFRLASQVAEGGQVAISFATLEHADRFAREAGALDARVEIRVAAAAAG